VGVHEVSTLRGSCLIDTHLKYIAYANSICRSIGQSLASLKNLKTLRLVSSEFKAEDMKPLAAIKNLKHLWIFDNSLSGNSVDKRNVTQSIIRNSLSTLQSLAVETCMYSLHLLQDWESNVSGKVASLRDSHDLIALKSLLLSGIDIDTTVIKSLHKAIDFMQLDELTLVDFHDVDGVFSEYFTSLATLAQGTAKGISLRRLSLKMSNDNILYTSEQKNAELDAKCRFISSFGTLTALELLDYGQYPKNITTNPGLSDMLLQAILKHKHLRTLKIHYVGIRTDSNVPYLLATTVGTIIDGLPSLQEFEFAPDEEQMVSFRTFCLASLPNSLMHIYRIKSEKHSSEAPT
jgi:hypothetical protein